MTVKAPPILESDFLRSVTDLATRYQWEWVHWLPGQHRDAWRTTYRGPLGKGFPDLLMLRERDGRALAIELKRDGGHPTEDQLRVLALFDECGFETGWFTPSGWDQVEQVLR